MKVAVVGAGGWGTALAKLLCENRLDVHLWCREEEVRRSIRERSENELFLRGIRLPEPLIVTGSLVEAVSDAEIILLAVPSPYVRRTLTEMTSSMVAGARLVSATKGLEEETHLRMSEVIDEVLAEVGAEVSGVVALSGPTFAREVAKGEPTALVAASASLAAAEDIQTRFSTGTFRIYTNDDVVGVELGGALKNVVALAVGVATGLGLGHNPAAALMTRGLAEIARLVEAMGGRRETLLGLAGMGDSRAHLHRPSFPQPPGGYRARQRKASFGDSPRDGASRGGDSHDPRRRRPRPSPRCRNADRPPHGAPAPGRDQRRGRDARPDVPPLEVRVGQIPGRNAKTQSPPRRKEEIPLCVFAFALIFRA